MREKSVSLNSFHASGNSPTLCRIAILGLGTVGSAVARRLTSVDPVRGLATHAHLRSPRRATSATRSPDRATTIAWTTCIDDVLTSDVDIVVEAIGGVEPAADWIRAALLAGKSVVTANKQVIARHGPRC